MKNINYKKIATYIAIALIIIPITIVSLMPNISNADVKKNTSVSNLSNMEQEEIIFCSAQWCSACKVAEQEFNSQGIKYTKIDIDNGTIKDRKFCVSLQRKIGCTGVPVIQIGNNHMCGFSKDGLQCLLGNVNAPWCDKYKSENKIL